VVVVLWCVSPSCGGRVEHIHDGRGPSLVVSIVDLWSIHDRHVRNINQFLGDGLYL